MSEVEHAYNGSDAGKTRAVFLRLLERGPIGDVAVNLFRTAKASERAKKYRGSSVRAAYDKKDWSIGELCRALVIHENLAISWGWGRDPKAIGFENVLYVDLPGGHGQVSFHTGYRRDGPDYAGGWDGVRGQTAPRIIKFANAVLLGEPLNREEDHATQRRRTEAAAAPGAEGGEPQQALDL